MGQPRWSRRSFLGAGTAAALATATGCRPAASTNEADAPPPPVTPPAGVTPEALASDQGYWANVAANYDVLDDIIQLENGNWGMMPRSVLRSYEELTGMVNRRNSYYARREFGEDSRAVRRRAAEALGVDPDEIVFTRNATEALQALIGNYNRLRPGDVVMYADSDYDSMQTAMAWLKIRRGVELVTFDMPEPATRQAVLDTYEAQLKANPKVRLLLLTHLSHRNGLVIPVAEITDMAAAHGADVIVDAAHSFGQMRFQARDLKAPFIGFNLHKWIGAPLGVGVAYIAKDRLGDMDPYMAGPEYAGDNIGSRVHTGTMNFAAILSVPEALDFHDAVGVANKEARLKRLRALWAEELQGRPGIEILTPDDDTMHAGITSFRLTGVTGTKDNIALVERLLSEFNIFTVHRSGLANGACIRVTPALFTSEDDVLALKDALVKITA